MKEYQARIDECVALKHELDVEIARMQALIDMDADDILEEPSWHDANEDFADIESTIVRN